MSPRPLLVTLGLLFALTGCSKDPVANNDSVPLAEGRVSGGVYTHPGFGWTMKIPTGWRVKTLEEAAAVVKRGQEAMEKTAGQTIDTGATVNLLQLQRDPFNQFTSAAEHFDPAKDGSYAENHESLVQLMLKTYAEAGLNVSHARRTETISGVKFNVLEATILGPDRKKVLLHQAMYDALLGERALTVSLNWNNDAARDELFAAWRGSTFSALHPNPPATSERR